jgi:hypothetical protein
MNHYRDSMMAFYRDRIVNDKSARPLPDARSLIARWRIALEKGSKQRNEKRPALKQGGKQTRRNEIRLALLLGKGGKSRNEKRLQLLLS